MSTLQDVILIMKDVSRIAADLIDCQVDRFACIYRNTLTKVLTWLLIALAAIALAVGGLAMILRGAYLQLSLVAGPSAAAFILGVLLILAAVIVFLIAANTLKEK